jgi:AcrR family transcriptional regulator
VSSPGDATPIWARPAPGERKPAHTRERIAAAALEVADTEGFEAVTMRRVAAALGAGTMTLYHYVRNKRELVALMDDARMAELVIPEQELADDWREGMAQIARRSYATFLRHPWIFDRFAAEEAPGPGGPNALRHVEQSLAAAGRTGLPIEGQMELVGLVDDYVWGHAMRNRAVRENQDVGEERIDALVAYLEAQLATGEFPQLSAFAGDDVRASFERLAELGRDPERFERGLQSLLDGIEMRLVGRPGTVR